MDPNPIWLVTLEEEEIETRHAQREDQARTGRRQPSASPGEGPGADPTALRTGLSHPDLPRVAPGTARQ